MSIPQRGEVWLADCGMVAKTRSVVAISIPFTDTDRALITVVPHTTSLVGSAFEVAIPVPWLQAGAFNVQAVFPLPPARFIRRLGSLNQSNVSMIKVALKHWEGLS